MFIYKECVLEKLIIHKTGNKQSGVMPVLSKKEITINDPDIIEILTPFFLKPFKTGEIFMFDNKEHIPVKESVTAIFEDVSNFEKASIEIAKTLYDASEHHNIKTGELYITYFSNLVIDEELVDAVGIFKTENKDTFIKVYIDNDNVQVNHDQGININKLDKGCLIFNTEADLGYKIYLVDNTNRGNDARYWGEEFLKVCPRPDNFYQTKTILSLCKDFSGQVLTPENNIDKTEQVNFVSKVAEYFTSNNVFDEITFEEKVLSETPEIGQAFKKFKKDYEEVMEIEPLTQFEIADQAVKKNNKYMKSVIKLDKNFHIYVHSKPEFIEKGFDETKGLKYYKLYFEEEN
ncbi:MAG: nucleoid-associated protein [Bacteroidales bacterium]